jgi:zinc protease
MHTSIAQRVTYERLTNGCDVYILPGSTPDVVVAELSFPGGTYVAYDTPLVALVLGLLLPGSTKTQGRTEVLHALERLGAQVGVEVEDTHLTVSVSSRRSVFPAVMRIVADILTEPTFPAAELTESVTRLRSSFEQAHEQTQARAAEALHHALFRKGHPHWAPTLRASARALTTLTRAQVAGFYQSTLTSVGATVCIVGDVDVEATLFLMREVGARFPQVPPADRKKLHVDRVIPPHERPDTTIVSLRDKINVDTYLGIPTMLTREHSAYHALVLGVAILGASATSRLFHELRTKRSLTYGSYASLQGFSDGYPGFLRAKAIFPHDVFARAVPHFKDTVRSFIERGVSRDELVRRKEEMRGSYVVGLSTSAGLLSALTHAVSSGRGVQYLDEYLPTMDALTREEVNCAIREHLHYEQAVVVGAGAIDAEGKPLM